MSNRVERQVLTREAILAGAVQSAARSVPGMAVLSESDLRASLSAVLESRRETGPIWVFGYGSLIWNPTIRFDAQMCGRLYGWRRRFCIKTSLSRGSPERPGLTLALDRGGSCTGVLYRIPEERIQTELRLLWQREMADHAYTPRWVPLAVSSRRVHALAFTANRESVRYVGKLDELETAQIVATAAGQMGTCADYLHRTVSALESHGLRDERLMALQARVRSLR